VSPLLTKEAMDPIAIREAHRGSLTDEDIKGLVISREGKKSPLWNGLVKLSFKSLAAPKKGSQAGLGPEILGGPVINSVWKYSRRATNLSGGGGYYTSMNPAKSSTQRRSRGPKRVRGGPEQRNGPRDSAG